MDFSAYLASSSEGEVEEEEEEDRRAPVNEEEQIRKYRVSGEATGMPNYFIKWAFLIQALLCETKLGKKEEEVGGEEMQLTWNVGQ